MLVDCLFLNRDRDIPSLPQVWIHVNLQVLGAQVALGSQEHLNVLAGSIENAGQVSGGHDCDCWTRKEWSSRKSQFVVGQVDEVFAKMMAWLGVADDFALQPKKSVGKSQKSCPAKALAWPELRGLGAGLEFALG